MKGTIHLCLLSVAVMVSFPAAAQTAVQVPLFDGALVMRGEVAVTESNVEPEASVLSFWRPVLFGTAERPIGGRMDCRLGGVREAYSDALFDVEARYEDNQSRRLNNGLNDDSVEFEANEAVARLEIVGRANGPHRHYVLTYLALRDGGSLYDIRLNCEFKHLQDPGDVDYAAIMHQFVDLAVPATSPAPSSDQNG